MKFDRETRESRPHQQMAARAAWAPIPAWRSRGYLPHCDEAGFVQFITFRLSDSVPANLISEWRRELKIIPGLSSYDSRKIELSQRLDKYEDACRGGCMLRNPQIAEIAQNTLLFFDCERYRLLEWCIMPNHVHVLILPINGHLIANIVHSWKSYTANTVKKLFNLAGPFWAREYHDRFIRNELHLEAVANYIHQNPVSAGLVRNAEDWLWSSVRRNAGTGSAGVPAGGDWERRRPCRRKAADA